MGVSLRILAVDSDEFETFGTDPDAMIDLLVNRGWEADQLGWAAFALAVGVEGVALLAADGGDIRTVSALSEAGLTGLDDAVANTDRATLAHRFDERAFGEPLGPEPRPEDRDWIVDAAQEIIELIQHTSANNSRLLWAMF